VKTEHAEVEGIPVVWVAPAGEPTGVALWLTHLDAYRRDVAISFQCGGAAQHEHVVAHALDWLTDAGDPY